MIQGMTLQQLAQELDRRAAAKRDFVADTREIGFLAAAGAQAALVIGGDPQKTFHVTDHTHGQIAEKAGIPKKYYDRMRQEAPELLERNVRYWFGHQPERRMVRTLDGNARGWCYISVDLLILNVDTELEAIDE